MHKDCVLEANIFLAYDKAEDLPCWAREGRCRVQWDFKYLNLCVRGDIRARDSRQGDQSATARGAS